MPSTDPTPAAVVERFIVDNSVWARIGHHPSVATGLKAIINEHNPSAIWHCPPTVAEIGFSARSGDEHTALMNSLREFGSCPAAPTVESTLAIQNRLWNAGLVRAVGAVDAMIAAYALANDATVLHYDSDFEYVARTEPGFRHRWVVPRGSIAV